MNANMENVRQDAYACLCILDQVADQAETGSRKHVELTRNTRAKLLILGLSHDLIELGPDENQEEAGERAEMYWRTFLRRD